MNRLSFIINLKQEVIDASILREVSYQERNERPEEHNHEERQAGNPGCMPYMWDEDVQNRKGLIQPSITVMCKAGHCNEECPAFLLYARQQNKQMRPYLHIMDKCLIWIMDKAQAQPTKWSPGFQRAWSSYSSHFMKGQLSQPGRGGNQGDERKCPKRFLCGQLCSLRIPKSKGKGWG